ncbi:MAG: 3-phosphoshikimate 1-carboxyvinyltransferase [Spirochaetales bacterium]|nr:3-phosphoshikimate 1-carboxyvinyltransferase [Spirochaetales bacterium]
MTINPSKAKGSITAPPSKSMAHRHLICAALADGRSTIRNIDLSEDIKATIGCINQLGCNVTTGRDSIEVEQCGEVCSNPVFRCNESGSTLRFFIPIALVLCGRARFEGSDVLMSRPLTVYEDICRNQGIRFERGNGGIEVEGRIQSGTFKVPGNISSQFITGLLFALPLLDGDSTIEITESVESRPYIDMTIQVLNEFGVKVEWKNERTLAIKGNQEYRACTSTVEGDYSNAAFLEAFNTIGGDVDVTGLNPDSLQGDKVYRDLFKLIEKGFCSIDISDCPDLGPVLMAVAALHNGARFTGTRRLKIKESDRGAAMCLELSKFGVRTRLEENEIVVEGCGARTPDEPVCSHNDHRIAMSMAVMLSVTGGRLEGSGAVRKSYPGFFDDIGKLGVSITEE